ncbi:MAG: 3-oxoacyl-ACP synthase III family protein [Opitutia bacterium]
MPKAVFKSVQLESVVGCAGPVVRRLDEDASALFADAPEQVARIRDFVGIQSRHIAPAGITALDLCEKAARVALGGQSPDAIVFVTQTPDHPQPCNANILHGRLGLGKDVACFDINQGCSGWVYGLWVACSLVEAGGCERVLLCAGDTISQIIHPKDRAVVPLFGDAGTATVLTRRTAPGNPLVFSLHSDGTGKDAICVPHGGARRPIGPDSSAESADAEGNVRNPCSLLMSGLEVFNFTLREEPGAIKSLLSSAGLAAADIDHLVFHQANKFILTNLAKRVGVPLDKVPMRTLAEFGNQSSASIPFAMAHELATSLAQGERTLLASGFGVGLSWASFVGKVGPIARCQTVPFA